MKERIICIMFAAILCISLVPESRTKAAELKTEWSGDELAQPQAGEIILPVNKTANSSTSDLTARWLPEGTELAQPWENEISPDNDWIMRWMQPEGGEIILSTKKPENSSTSDLTVRWLPEGTKLAWPWETEISPDDDRTVRWTGPKDGKIILPIEKADSYSFSDLTVRWLPAGTELPWPWETEISPDDDRTVRWTRPEAVE